MRRLLAWAGLLLMLLSLVWLELLPQAPRLTSDRPTRRGPLRLLIIDPGHGGKDSGTMRNGVMEKDLTLDVAQRLERLARARGFSTLMTRTADARISLAGRASLANRAPDCIFVSIHFDEGARPEATGVQTFYAARQTPKLIGLSRWFPFLGTRTTDPENLQSQSLAGLIQESLVARVHASNRGTRAEQFYVVTNVRHPAVLVEGGFLSNPEEMAKLSTAEYREQLAAAIADGVERYRALAE